MLDLLNDLNLFKALIRSFALAAIFIVKNTYFQRKEVGQNYCERTIVNVKNLLFNRFLFLFNVFGKQAIPAHLQMGSFQLYHKQDWRLCKIFLQDYRK